MNKTKLISKEILLRLLHDDEKAFDYIYWKYNSHIYNFANSLLYSEDIAQNVTQNVFIKIWEKRHEIDPEQNFNAYLFTIARNMIYKETEQRFFSDSLIPIQEDYDISDISTEQALDCHFTEEYYHRLIEELPLARRKIFKLSRLKKMSNKEIAVYLSISEKTVETQLYRATYFLKQKLLTEENLGIFILLFITSD